MAATALVTDDFHVGAAILERLDEAKLTVKAAMWAYDEKAGEWRYLVATAWADVEGPRQLYERVQRALSRADTTRNFPFWRVVLVSPKSDLVRALKSMIGKLESPQGTGFNIDGLSPYLQVVVYRMS